MGMHSVGAATKARRVAVATLAIASALTLAPAAAIASPQEEAVPEMVLMSPEEYADKYYEEHGEMPPADLPVEEATTFRTSSGSVVDTESPPAGNDVGIRQEWRHIMWEHTDRRGTRIPTRRGNTRLGYLHYASRHNLLTNAPWRVIPNTSRPIVDQGAHLEYQAILANPSNLRIKMKFRIVAWAGTVTADDEWATNDGKYVGTITAYCENQPNNRCPNWVNAL